MHPKAGAEAAGGGPRAFDATPRIHALDALRGFALCGIIYVNIYQVMLMPSALEDLPPVLGLFIRERFFPIFSLLFGVSFGIFLRRVEGRADQPWLLLARRLVTLAAFGALHGILQPGEVLLPYGVIGLVVLLPLSWAHPRRTLALGVLLLGAGLLLGGGIALIPGLFVLGFALTAEGVPETLDRRRTQLGAVLLGFGGLSAVGLWLHTRPVGEVVMDRLPATTGLLMAFGYIAGVLLLLRTPLGVPVAAVLVPLGRMALTNYVTATLLFVPLGHALGLYRSTDWGTEALLATGILLVQAVVSPLWLAVFRYGPLEWVLRCATWWQVVPLRRRPLVKSGAG